MTGSPNKIACPICGRRTKWRGLQFHIRAMHPELCVPEPEAAPAPCDDAPSSAAWEAVGNSSVRPESIKVETEVFVSDGMAHVRQLGLKAANIYLLPGEARHIAGLLIGAAEQIDPEPRTKTGQTFTTHVSASSAGEAYKTEVIVEGRATVLRQTDLTTGRVQEVRLLDPIEQKVAIDLLVARRSRG